MGTLQFFCEKCKKVLNEDLFYGSNNLEKYPEKKLHICKKCATLHVDNWDPDTYLWILQECDVPYIPDEWNRLLERYGRDPSKLTGLTIIGRYLSKMKLKQYKDYRWKDTEFLQELADNKMEQTMKRQGYDAAEITKAIEENKTQIPEKEYAPPDFSDNQFENPIDNSIDAELVEQLTDEDKTFLRLKWGSYSFADCVRLEQLYTEMMESYDIQGAGSIDNLKLLCKTSLKANQLIDMGDKQSMSPLNFLNCWKLLKVNITT